MRRFIAQFRNTSAYRYPCLAVLAVLFAAPHASATLMNASVGFTIDQTPAAGCSEIGRPSADCSSSGLLMAKPSAFNGGLDGKYFGRVSAGASFGDVWAGYEVSYVPASGWIQTVHGYGHSGFEDLLTLHGDSGRGYVQFILDGTFRPRGDSPLGGHEDFTITVAGVRNEVSPACCGGGSQQFLYQTGLDPITFGRPFGLGMMANVSLLTDGGEGAPRGWVDARIAGIRVYDGAGQAIPFSLSAQSGTDYPALAPTPEPSGILLLATALCGIGIMVAGKRRSRHG